MAELYSEEYPVVKIRTTMNSAISQSDLIEDIKLVILNEPFESNEKESTDFATDFANNKVFDLIKYETSGYEVFFRI